MPRSAKKGRPRRHVPDDDYVVRGHGDDGSCSWRSGRASRRTCGHAKVKVVQSRQCVMCDVDRRTRSPEMMVSFFGLSEWRSPADRGRREQIYPTRRIDEPRGMFRRCRSGSRNHACGGEGADAGDRDQQLALGRRRYHVDWVCRAWRSSPRGGRDGPDAVGTSGRGGCQSGLPAPVAGRESSPASCLWPARRAPVGGARHR